MRLTATSPKTPLRLYLNDSVRRAEGVKNRLAGFLFGNGWIACARRRDTNVSAAYN
jgi:hypothetical protein